MEFVPFLLEESLTRDSDVDPASDASSCSKDMFKTHHMSSPRESKTEMVVSLDVRNQKGRHDSDHDDDFLLSKRKDKRHYKVRDVSSSIWWWNRRYSIVRHETSGVVSTDKGFGGDFSLCDCLVSLSCSLNLWSTFIHDVSPLSFSISSLHPRCCVYLFLSFLPKLTIM